MNAWLIGLDAWIVQDGNYPDFSTGQEAEFAVAFYSQQGLDGSTSSANRSARYLKDSDYSVEAQVRYDQEDLLVLDVGIGVFTERPKHHFLIGTSVTGEVNLSVDPFFYFEQFAKLPHVPPLVYSWTVRHIRRQTAPFVPSGNGLIRDQSQWNWAEVDRTDAWNDDGGYAAYLLECELRPVDPKRSTVTAQSRPLLRRQDQGQETPPASRTVTWGPSE